MAAHEQDPKNSSLGQTAIWFSNDAQTEFEQVAPSNPLPVAVESGSIVITPITSATLTPSQVTVPATANGILILAANANRKGATISNPGPLTVYVQQGSTGVTISNGFGIPSGDSYNIDEPLYLGAIYGIISTGTQVVTVVELT